MPRAPTVPANKVGMEFEWRVYSAGVLYRSIVVAVRSHEKNFEGAVPERSNKLLFKLGQESGSTEGDYVSVTGMYLMKTSLLLRSTVCTSSPVVTIEVWK